jgi:hypothetical protein
MPQENRLPGPEIFCLLHLHSAICRLADALLADDLDDCQESYEWSGLLWCLNMAASSLESSVRVHPLVTKSHKRVLKKLIQLQREEIDCGYLRLETIATISIPSRS